MTSENFQLEIYMKIIFSLLLSLFFLTALSGSVFAQYRKLTVILLRHAEKDISEEADSANPDLSAEGNLRAQRLVEELEKYKPDAVFSTQTIRTRATIIPFARKHRIMIQLYDYKNLDEMADLAASGKVKRIVIIGHNSTTPELVDKLIGENKYKPLGEFEYDKIFIVKIKKRKNKPNKVRANLIVY